MGSHWTGKWAGGRLREVQGRQVWCIQRRYGGRRYDFALEAKSETEALAELALFERNPPAYRTRRQFALAQVDDAPVRCDQVTVAAFLAHLEREGRVKRYRHDMRNYLAQWAGKLAGRDLRGMDGRVLRSALGGWPTARKLRIIAIKSFCSWLRAEGHLTSGNDPARDLKVPAPRPEKVIRPKGYPADLVERLYTVLWRQDVRDVVRLRAVVGMHHSEIERLPASEICRVDDPTGIAGTARFIHKSQREHIVSLDAPAFAAAERLAKGKIPRDHTVAQTCERAAASLGIDGFNPGELRHSFATWAEESGEVVYPRGRGAGAPGELISAVMGHTEATTRKRFYSGVKVPPMIRLPIRLVHPDDPTPGGSPTLPRRASLVEPSGASGQAPQARVPQRSAARPRLKARDGW